MVLTTIGIVVGMLLGSYVPRVIEHQLYAIDPLDLPTFAGAAILMIVTGRHCSRLSAEPWTRIR